MNQPPHKDSLPSGSFPERFVYLALFLLMGVVVALVWPALTLPPFLDDKDHLSHVAGFRGWKDTIGIDCFGLFRPFKNIVYYSFHRLGSHSPFLWHCVPLGINLAAIAAVFARARRLAGSPVTGLIAAALWALSTTQATTVIWMACFNISLSAMFLCLAVLQYDRSWDTDRPWAVRLPVCLILSFLALISYETALCVAPVCVALDVFRKRQIFSKPALIRYAALGALTLGFLILRYKVGGISKVNYSNFNLDPAMPAWQLSISAPWLLWRHFSMWFFPFGRLEIMSTYVWGKSASMLDLAAAWGFLVALGAVWLIALRRLPLLAFGIAWFFLASFPTSNFIPMRSGPIEDYYLVIPGVGLALAVAALIRTTREWMVRAPGSAAGHKQLIATCLVGAILELKLAGIPLFRHQASLWKDPLQLYLSAAYGRPGQYQHKNLAARELISLGDYATAKKLAEESLADGPWYTINYLLLGEIAMRTQEYQAAAHYFELSKPMADSNASFREFIQIQQARILVASGKLAEARDLLLPLLQRPNSEQHFQATLVLADIYIKQGNPEKARQTMEKSVALHPEKSGEIEQVILRLGTPSPTPPGQ